MENQRSRRLKSLFRSLNKQKRQQKKKIDILCNDIIASQKNFVEKLSHYNFVLDFYESIIGQTNYKKLISTAGNKIKAHSAKYSIGIYILENGRFEFILDNNKTEIETAFSMLLCQKISRNNTVLSTNDLAIMGLDSDLEVLKKADIRTIPISGYGAAVGFLAIWTIAPEKIKQADISRLQTICPCLAKAARSCMQNKTPKNIKCKV